MAIDKTTNQLSTTNARGDKAANRYRSTQSGPDTSVADSLTAAVVPSGQLTDFTGLDKKALIDAVYQNVADGYLGRMTVPGGATVHVTELTSSHTLAFMPDGAYRRTSAGKYVEVPGAYLFLPIAGEGRGAEDKDETVAKGKRMIKIVIGRAQKAKVERDARDNFIALQADAVDLADWEPGEDVDADSLIETELSAARLGFRGHNFGPIVDLNKWEPGEDVDDDMLVRDELENYRGRYGN
jgi:hypothetical protein